MSLKLFASLVGVAAWQLRDYERLEQQRQATAERRARWRLAVEKMARQHPTLGYRALHACLVLEGVYLPLGFVRAHLRQIPPPLFGRRKTGKGRNTAK
jgi:hypothetical protein